MRSYIVARSREFLNLRSNSSTSSPRAFPKFNMQPDWQPVSSHPGQECRSNVLMLNEREFIIGTNRHQIFKYNAHRDEWTLFVESLGIFQNGNLSMVLDHNGLRMSGGWNEILTVDINNGEQTGTRMRKCWIIHGGSMMFWVNAGGTIHKVCWGHSVWNRDTCIWDKYKVPDQFGGNVAGASLVYVPSKRIILMIGGRRSNYGPIGIWRFVIASSEWEQMVQPDAFPNESVAAVLTSNEEKVIIAGGRDCAPIDSTYVFLQVLDISNDDRYGLWQSTIRCPLTRGRGDNAVEVDHCARTSGRSESRLLTVGWIRKTFTSEAVIERTPPPLAIVELIVDWCCIEMIHWISGRTVLSNKQWRNHFVLPLTQILSSDVRNVRKVR